MSKVILNAKRTLDPCGQYKDHKTEDIILACGILPTHVDENNPENLVDQVCLACNTTRTPHMVKGVLNIDEHGVVFGDGGDVYFPLAVISRTVDGKVEALYIHNGGQMIMKDEADETSTYYGMVVGN